MLKNKRKKCIVAGALALSLSSPSFADAEAQTAALLGLQKFATEKKASKDGVKFSLTNLNSTLGRWWVLSRTDSNGTKFLNIETVPGSGALSLSDSGKLEQKSSGCSIDIDALSQRLFAKRSGAYSQICGDIWARAELQGKKTLQEAGTDILRETGGAGEAVINVYKSIFASSTGEAAVYAPSQSAAGPVDAVSAQSSPKPAAFAAGQKKGLSTAGFGVPLAASSLSAGSWAPVQGTRDTFVSIATPGMASESISGDEGRDSLAYFVAIDMSGQSAGYKVGVEHPSLGWSSRSKFEHKTPGPDGFNSAAPLARVGAPAPWELPKLSFVIGGGFKREHSAFKKGPFSEKDLGSHYGFVEDGVVLSSMKTGLGSIWQRSGQRPKMGVWSDAEASAGAKDLLFARQNGMLLIENGSPTGAALGSMLGGNWSGNAEGASLTFRTALCELDGGRWWVAAAFTSATPKAMALTMKAFGCQTAMQMDINSPALGYMAVAMPSSDGKVKHFPLLKSMDDKSFGPLGRFISAPDSRDFLYFMREGHK